MLYMLVTINEHFQLSSDGRLRADDCSGTPAAADKVE
jgi:hypothetical protein